MVDHLDGKQEVRRQSQRVKTVETMKTGAGGDGSHPGAGFESVLIGPSTSSQYADGEGSVAIGALSYAWGYYSVAIGDASAGEDSVSIGDISDASGTQAVAIGRGADASHDRSVALGDEAITTAEDQLQVGSRHIEMPEITAPSSPASNAVRLFARDNGSGKTQVVALFASGSAVVIATEP